MTLLSPQLAAEVSASEKVLWSGQPRQGIFLRATDAFLIPFSVAWGGFAIFWEASVIALGAPVFFALFGSIFVVIGLYLMVGRFFVDARQRAATFYAVTNERILIISGLFSKTVKSIDLNTLGEMSFSQRNDGGGTIVFGASSFFDRMYGDMPGWPGFGVRSQSRFELGSKARAVYETIRSAQRLAK